MTNPSFEDSYRNDLFWPLIDFAMKAAERLNAWRQRGSEQPAKTDEVRLAR